MRGLQGLQLPPPLFLPPPLGPQPLAPPPLAFAWWHPGFVMPVTAPELVAASPEGCSRWHWCGPPHQPARQPFAGQQQHMLFYPVPARMHRAARTEPVQRVACSGSWCQAQRAACGGSLGGGRFGCRYESRRPYQASKAHSRLPGGGRVHAVGSGANRNCAPYQASAGGGHRPYSQRERAKQQPSHSGASRCFVRGEAGLHSGGGGKDIHHGSYIGVASSSARSGAPGFVPGSGRRSGCNPSRYACHAPPHRRALGVGSHVNLELNTAGYQPGTPRCDSNWENRLPCGLLPSQLSDLLFREITPEDYDLLLQLDESVKKPTASQASVESLPEAGKEDFAGKSCTICLLAFEHCDEVAALPCEHFFHRSCIAKWLMERKPLCPLCCCEVFPS